MGEKALVASHKKQKREHGKPFVVRFLIKRRSIRKRNRPVSPQTKLYLSIDFSNRRRENYIKSATADGNGDKNV